VGGLGKEVRTKRRTGDGYLKTPRTGGKELA